MLCCISTLERDAAPASPISPQLPRSPLLILGGYSYGSLITSCLPPCELVSRLFDVTGEDTAEAEIKSRAQKTARDVGAYFEMLRNGSIGRGRSSLRVSDAVSPTKRRIAMGGYDSEATSRRISRESSRRSLDGERVRRSLDRARHKIRSRVASDQYPTAPSTPPSRQGGFLEMRQPAIAYLLISPLLGPISMFTTMFSKPIFEKRDPQTGRIVAKDKGNRDQKFSEQPTCFIYGNKDVFTSDRKLKKWADDLHHRASATFCSYAVAEAGHFWSEAEASQRLQSTLKDWLMTIQQNRVTGSGQHTEG